MLRSFVDDEKGAELAEYALILALVVVAAITALGVLGSGVSSGITSASNGISGAGH
ncbi:MAG: Flp family type IVb pilin [Chloroflexi bacterium]|nr:Flp family type IVb pilin [Chloroflexota bacterium]